MCPSGTREPKYAPKDYHARGAVEEDDSGMFTYFIGSGIPIKKHPEYRLFVDYGGADDGCKECGSQHTHCIYFVHYACNAGHGIQFELVCLDCGWFSQYDYDEG